MAKGAEQAINKAKWLKAIAAFGAGNYIMGATTVPKTLDKVAQKILTDAKKRCPVQTGALRASGRVKRINKYQRIIQFGGRGTGVDYAPAVEFGTFRQRPQPFLEPAVKANHDAIVDLMRTNGQRLLNKIAKMGTS